MRSLPRHPPNSIESVFRSRGKGGIDVGACLHHLTDRSNRGVTTRLERTIRMPQMPQVVAQLAAEGDECAWAMFMFYTQVHSQATDDQCLNLQYSIEQGTLGLDWILLGERNIADQEAICQFARRKGHSVKRGQTNGVRYLRIEGDELAALGPDIAARLYGVNRTTDIGLLVDGFGVQLPCICSPSGGFQ
jgi:hypothetical protein